MSTDQQCLHCLHIMTESMPLKVGLLAKRGSNFPHRWQEREFRLHTSKIEYYVPGAQHSHPVRSAEYKGECLISHESRCDAINDFPEKSFVFKLVTASKQLLLTGRSEEERSEWMDVIGIAIKANCSSAASLLHEACREGNFEAVRAQLQEKVDVQVGDNVSWPIFMS